MSRKEVSMIGNLTRDMMRDVMETSLKKPIQTGEFRKNPVEPAWRCPNDYIYELIPTGKFVMEYLSNLLYHKLYFFILLFKIPNGIGNIAMQRHCEQIYDFLIILFHSTVDPV